MAAFDRLDLSEAHEYVGRILAGETLVQRARLDPVRACNLACRYCISRMRGGEGPLSEYSVPFETIEALVPVLRRMKTTTFQMYGLGEPFLHPRIGEIVRSIASAGMRLQIISNGTHVSEALMSAIADHRDRFQWLRFSLHGVDRESYRRNTGHRLRDQALANVAAIARLLHGAARTPMLSIFVPVTEELDAAGVGEVLDFAAACDLDFVTFAEDYQRDSREVRFPASRDTVVRLAAQHGVLVDYCPNRPRSYETGELCYSELSNLNLVYEPGLEDLLMVRCCNYYPTGLDGIPAAGFYRPVSPGSLYAAWKEHLARSLADRPFRCQFRGECKAARRNGVLSAGVEASAPR